MISEEERLRFMGFVDNRGITPEQGAAMTFDDQVQVYKEFVLSEGREWPPAWAAIRIQEEEKKKTAEAKA